MKACQIDFRSSDLRSIIPGGLKAPSLRSGWGEGEHYGTIRRQKTVDGHTFSPKGQEVGHTSKEGVEATVCVLNSRSPQIGVFRETFSAPVTLPLLNYALGGREESRGGV